MNLLIEADWDLNGNWEAIPNVLAVRIERGRFSERTLYPVGVATVDIEDANDTYHPRNSSSPLYGAVLPGRPMRVAAQYGGDEYRLFTGYLQRIVPRGRHVVRMELQDRLGVLKENSVSIGVVENKYTGEVVSMYLDSAGVDADRVIDTGNTIVQYAYIGGRFGEVLADLCKAEYGRLYVDKQGVIRYEERSKRFKKTLPEWTIEPQMILDISPPTGWDWVRNKVEVTAAPVEFRSPGALWETLSRLAVEAGESVTLWADYRDPATLQPCGGESVSVTYDANTAEDGGGADISADVDVAITAFGTRAKATVTNNSTEKAYVHLSLVGTPVIQQNVSYLARDADSEELYGQRELRIKSRALQQFYTARGMAKFILSQRKDPVDPILLLLDVREAGELGLELELSQRVRVVSDVQYLDRDYFVEGLRYDLRAGGAWRLQVYGEPADMSGEYWMVGYSELGISTRLAF